jgi:N-acetylglucosamine-6-sulfatase
LCSAPLYKERYVRKKGLLLASVALAMGLLFSGAYAGGGDDKRSASAQAAKPNVLLVLIDDAHPSMVNRLPAVRELLVQQGTTYQNAVSNYPLCCPGRVALLRGQYAHNHRIADNDDTKFFEYGYQRSNLPTWLNDVGYRTALFGKYLNNYAGKDIPPGWDRWYAWNGPLMGWSSVNDQGRTFALDSSKADALVSDNALRFLSNTPEDQPFFAWAGFGTPHEPFYYDFSTKERFTGVSVPRSPAFNEADVSDKPPYVKNLSPLSRAQQDSLDANYRAGLRGLLQVDAFLTKAIATLRERGMLENTYIIFYSDNGNHFGEHRLPYGKQTPYETDINFPFIVRGPGVPRGTTSHSLVANHDFAPTVAALGGASVPTFVDGRSFRPLLTNPRSTAWPRKRVLVEKFLASGPLNPAWNAIRYKTSVYVEYETNGREYYNLASDPHQLNNRPFLAPTNAPTLLADLKACRGAECRRLEE